MLITFIIMMTGTSIFIPAETARQTWSGKCVPELAVAISVWGLSSSAVPGPLWCCGLNWVPLYPQNSRGEVLIASTSECDWIGDGVFKVNPR